LRPYPRNWISLYFAKQETRDDLVCHVAGIVDIPRDRADELCEMFRRNEWFCGIARS
jgi:hypothetical protein